MPPNHRLRVDPMEDLDGLTPAEHRRLMQVGADDPDYWSLPDKAKFPDDLTAEEAALWAVYKPQIAAFRANTKDYYFWRQRRRCCYCSIELTEHKLAYDAEHVLDKGTHPQFMFELKNICVACKRCNGFKGKQPVLTGVQKPAMLPTQSADYSILHPHLDEWPTHLRFDDIGRIAPMPGAGEAKGQKTIEVCGINHYNATRLVDAFQPGGNPKTTHEALEVLLCEDSDARKQANLQFLRELVTTYRLPEAIAVVDCLEAELRAKQAPVAPAAQPAGMAQQP